MNTIEDNDSVMDNNDKTQLYFGSAKIDANKLMNRIDLLIENLKKKETEKVSQ